ncbi:unnamed protein product [Arabidopsis thaliana]|uniref:Uncharacterized protein n=1 Tax=Arabidopsis thaliana TaxID=3702 RepID=A0A654FP87_ARATH|nr:unnamed protein product [Arabidopsis thaliana]
MVEMKISFYEKKESNSGNGQTYVVNLLHGFRIQREIYVMREIHLKSSDYRVLNLLLYKICDESALRAVGKK